MSDIAATLLHIRQRLNAVRRRMSPAAVPEVLGYVAALQQKLAKAPGWQELETFWPPRCVAALREPGRAAIFFGSGLSLPSGIPVWPKLLERFGLERAFLEDEDLKNDPLTMAELANNVLGSETLQDILRNQMKQATGFSIGHAMTALLGLDTYITTNYDSLFEDAWKAVHGKTRPLIVVTTDGDMPDYDGRPGTATVLFKIHGSASRHDEQMILTRRDYRRHYRVNRRMFERVAAILGERDTIFLGFSHRDPEVSRLVDDVIHTYERKVQEGARVTAPRFYSLQFDLRPHTSEAFAARGIVTLAPPVTAVAAEDIWTAALSVALTDLAAASAGNLFAPIDLETRLRSVADPIGTAIARALTTLESHIDDAARALTDVRRAPALLRSVATDLGDLASQGVYLVDAKGKLADLLVPAGLHRPSRIRELKKVKLQERPYFQEAKLHRHAFASSSTRSVFNGRATFFLCAPIFRPNDSVMRGLLFAAAQVGQWMLPIDLATPIWDDADDLLFLLIDSNGVCLVPPERGLQPEAVEVKNEEAEANRGYEFEKMLGLSRRDSVVKQVTRSVVPVAQDDDVLKLAEDLRYYVVTSEVPRTRWKIGVARPIQSMPAQTVPASSAPRKKTAAKRIAPRTTGAKRRASPARGKGSSRTLSRRRR